MSGPPEQGALLVASPSLADPNFFRSVVFLLAHDADGTLGVVLNRPSDMPVDEVVPAWDDLAATPRVLFTGGPVQPNAAICIGRTERPEAAEAAGFAALVGSLGTVDLHVEPEHLEVPLAEVRVFAGYAGWGEGQLYDEIAAGAWYVLEATNDDVLCDDPEHLWARVLRRQGGLLSAVARYPTDPSTN